MKTNFQFEPTNLKTFQRGVFRSTSFLQSSASGRSADSTSSSFIQPFCPFLFCFFRLRFGRGEKCQKKVKTLKRHWKACIRPARSKAYFTSSCFFHYFSIFSLATYFFSGSQPIFLKVRTLKVHFRQKS